MVGNGQIKDEETVDNTHKTNLYPPLGKGRLGGDDCTKRLPAACLQITNSLLYGHPLLRLPFPRGGYQLAFPLTVPYSLLPTVNLPATKKLLCYSVFQAQKQQKIYSVTLSPKHRSSRKTTLLLCLSNTEAAEKPFCYPVLQPEEARCSRLHVLLEAHASLHDVNHVVA